MTLNARWSEQDGCLGVALKYSAIGYSVVPLEPRGKRPLIPWAAYQKRRPTEVEIRRWWSDTPDANVGIVTGQVSNIFCLGQRRD